MKIENAEQLAKYLEDWDYGEDCFADEIIRNHVIDSEIHLNGESWDYDADNIPESYIEKLTVDFKYEDTNGIDDLDDNIRELFDEEIYEVCTAIRNNKDKVDSIIKSSPTTSKELMQVVDAPKDGEYTYEIWTKIEKVLELAHSY